MDNAGDGFDSGVECEMAVDLTDDAPFAEANLCARPILAGLNLWCPPEEMLLYRSCYPSHDLLSREERVLGVGHARARSCV
jgi:hypothetical protein